MVYLIWVECWVRERGEGEGEGKGEGEVRMGWRMFWFLGFDGRISWLWIVFGI